jgi:hypothetical protein
MMAQIVPLPGVFRPELEPATPIDNVLEGARKANLKDIAYVGRSITGEIIVGGSHPDADAAIGLLTRGIASLANSQQVHFEETDNPAG